jgi:putative hemolysin
VQSLWSQLFLIMLLVLLNAFFAGSEIAIISVRRTRIRQLINKGNRSAMLVSRLTRDPSRFLAAIQIGVTLSGFLASASAAVSLSVTLARVLKGILPIPGLAQVAEPLSIVVVTVMLSFVTLLFGELVPKRLALQQSEAVSLLVARPLVWFSWLTSPVVTILTWSSNQVVRLLGGNLKQREPKVTEDELRLLVAEQATLQSEEKEMIQGIFEFGDTIVREVMVPRPDIKAVSCALTVHKAVEVLLDTGLSRLPIYDGDLDNIIGLVTIKDLLAAMARGKEKRMVGELVRDVVFVPPSKPVLDLFRELKSTQQHLAIVLDEYGSVDGLVTLKDIVEEIVGDIDDEGAQPETWFERLDPRTVLVDGRMNTTDLNQEAGLQLPDPAIYETVGGLFMNQLGRIPEKGDSIKIGSLRLTVKSMEGYRVGKVLLEETE